MTLKMTKKIKARLKMSFSDLHLRKKNKNLKILTSKKRKRHLNLINLENLSEGLFLNLIRHSHRPRRLPRLQNHVASLQTKRLSLQEKLLHCTVTTSKMSFYIATEIRCLKILKMTRQVGSILTLSAALFWNHTFKCAPEFSNKVANSRSETFNSSLQVVNPMNMEKFHLLL